MNWQTEEESSDLSIGELSREVGLSPRTIRYYEEVGLLPGIRRRRGGRRVYGADQIQRLRFIQRLKTLGLALSEIKELNAVYAIHGSTESMLKYLAGLLHERLNELDQRISELIGLRDEMQQYTDHVGKRIQSLGLNSEIAGEDSREGAAG